MKLISYKTDGFSFTKLIIRCIGWLRLYGWSDETVHKMERTSWKIYQET